MRNVLAEHDDLAHPTLAEQLRFLRNNPPPPKLHKWSDGTLGSHCLLCGVEYIDLMDRYDRYGEPEDIDKLPCDGEEGS